MVLINKSCSIILCLVPAMCVKVFFFQLLLKLYESVCKIIKERCCVVKYSYILY